MSAGLKNRILCLGVRVPKELRVGRKAGAGPAGGRYLELGKSIVNAPIFGFSKKSSISLEFSDGDYYFNEHGKRYRAGLVQDPSFYEERTSDGTPMKRIALKHGRDCLATTVCQRCLYWRREEECHFCGIELSLRYDTTVPLKSPNQLAEVGIRASREGLTHSTLTTGTPNVRDRGTRILAQSARALKEETGMKIHVQLEPISRERIEILKESGADTIGIHIETLDSQVFKERCPGKAHQWDRYWEAWKNAVDIFGDNQVSSYVILGLGEGEKTTKKGIERMCQFGVIPFLVPLRPIEGTRMEGQLPPNPRTMLDYYLHSIDCIKTYGLDPTKNLAGCVRCGACSALMDFYEVSYAF